MGVKNYQVVSRKMLINGEAGRGMLLFSESRFPLFRASADRPFVSLRA